jgi:LmbE family N-acetylglucosaminyl deacetylase
MIKKLQVCGNVMYLAAHPDDENTNLITVFAKEKLLDVTYLSLTRGDGGQNLIGTEQGDLLGIIRTQELLEARNIDGGKQEFTRAKDFGFSKLPDETFQKWVKEKVLYDVVFAIRRLQPDVIVTRFSLEPGKTHGHHTASAMLAVEAAKLASDSTIFPEQLAFCSVHQTKRVVWNSSKWFYNDDQKLLEKNPIIMNAGNYNPLLGRSYNEISAASRSMHKSQGFGTLSTRGEQTEYFEHLWGDKAQKDIFENINFKFSRFTDSKIVEPQIEKIIQAYDPQNPSLSVPALSMLYHSLYQLPNTAWRNKKLNEVKNIIKYCMGLYLEAYSAKAFVSINDTFKCQIEIINRSAISSKLISVSTPSKTNILNKPIELDFNKTFTQSFQLFLSDQASISHPYWLEQAGSEGMYDFDFRMNQFPENLSLNTQVNIEILGQIFTYDLPIHQKKSDPVKGEIQNPLEIHHPVFINPESNLYIFNSTKPKEFKVKLHTSKSNVFGVLKIKLPKGWYCNEDSIQFRLSKINEEKEYSFWIKPLANPSNGSVSVETKVDGKIYNRSYKSITHSHILPQVYMPKAQSNLIYADIKSSAKRVAYIEGAGDEIPNCLRKISCEVSVIKPLDITFKALSKYDAVVMGVRAFNTIENISQFLPSIYQYVKAGGRLVIQYNTSQRLITDSIGPFKLKLSNERVTDEHATVSILNPQHPLLQFPNKISSSDFEGWVQERGLYFPISWDPQFQTLLACNDPNESPKQSGILFAPYGKGSVVYTSLSFFRQLPAGVVGAYRLFANLISSPSN